MNTVLVLVMLILVIFALKEGMIWVALGIGLVMVLVATTEDKPNPNKIPKQFLYSGHDLGPVSDGMKEQMLRVKYQPKWDGNNWWEEIADHWGTSLGRTIGLIR
jgi:hypothetical protein